MTQNYELYFILNSTLEAESVQTEINVLESFLKEIGGDKITSKIQGQKKLAYPIKKLTTGNYVLINFDLELENLRKVINLEKKLNLTESIIRYIIVNQTEYNKQSQKQKIKETEIESHREFNKGKKNKSCFVSYLGYRVIDYKDSKFLGQFTSPYSKIFGKDRTGTTSKNQRKVAQAIKRAKHMALIPFTPKHYK
jgi:ribosomal protein S18/ribosomal protein S6